MFHSKHLNNKITFIHESALRIQLKHELKHRLSPEVLRETFLSKTSFYNLRKDDAFERS